MLVERGSEIMDADVVRDSYFIAWHFLNRTGKISGSRAVDDRLVAIIVRLFDRGERNRLRLANKAIARFEASPTP